MTDITSIWESPFLDNHTLRNVAAIELDGIRLLAKELMDFQMALGGQLVVDTALRRALEKGYNNYYVNFGKRPDAVQSQSYPHKWFIPREITITKIIEGASRPLYVPVREKFLVFFAVPKIK